MLTSVALLPLFFLNNNVLAQERNFTSSCKYDGTSGVEYNYGKQGKCVIKTYASEDYLFVEVKSSWEKEKRIMRLDNKPQCTEWRDLSENNIKYSSNVCHGQYWYGGDFGWGYIVAYADDSNFGYSLGNAYMFSYDGPLLRPSSSTSQNSAQTNSSSNQTCSTAINQVAKQVHNYGTSVNVSGYNNANDRYTGNPTNRKAEIVFAMGSLNGSSKADGVAENILNSFQLQQDWANYLVKNCNNVAVVTFAKAHSGWNNQFAIQPNGLTEARECLDPAMSSGKFLPWNYTYCT